MTSASYVILLQTFTFSADNHGLFSRADYYSFTSRVRLYPPLEICRRSASSKVAETLLLHHYSSNYTRVKYIDLKQSRPVALTSFGVVLTFFTGIVPPVQSISEMPFLERTFISIQKSHQKRYTDIKESFILSVALFEINLRTTLNRKRIK